MLHVRSGPAQFFQRATCSFENMYYRIMDECQMLKTYSFYRVIIYVELRVTVMQGR